MPSIVQFKQVPIPSPAGVDYWVGQVYVLTRRGQHGSLLGEARCCMWAKIGYLFKVAAIYCSISDCGY